MADDPHRDLLPVKECSCSKLSQNATASHDSNTNSRSPMFFSPRDDAKQQLKVNRSDLEDRYLKVCEDNMQLKKVSNIQEEKLKRLATKLVRLMNERKRMMRTGEERREYLTAEQVDDQRYMIADLERSNRQLMDRVMVLKSQLATHSRVPAAMQRSPTRSPRRSYLGSNNVINQESVEVREQASNQTAEIAQLRNQINSMQQEMNAHSEQSAARISALEEELAMNSTEDRRTQTTENIELIRLRRELRQKAEQLEAFATRNSEVEKDVNRMIQVLHESQKEKDMLMEQLSKERFANANKPKHSDEDKIPETVMEYITDAGLEINDLKNEVQALKDHNQHLLRYIAQQSLENKVQLMKSKAKVDSSEEDLQKSRNQLAIEDVPTSSTNASGSKVPTQKPTNSTPVNQTMQPTNEDASSEEGKSQKNVDKSDSGSLSSDTEEMSDRGNKYVEGFAMRDEQNKSRPDQEESNRPASRRSSQEEVENIQLKNIDNNDNIPPSGVDAAGMLSPTAVKPSSKGDSREKSATSTATSGSSNLAQSSDSLGTDINDSTTDMENKNSKSAANLVPVHKGVSAPVNNEVSQKNMEPARAGENALPVLLEQVARLEEALQLECEKQDGLRHALAVEKQKVTALTTSHLELQGSLETLKERHVAMEQQMAAFLQSGMKPQVTPRTTADRFPSLKQSYDVIRPLVDQPPVSASETCRPIDFHTATGSNYDSYGKQPVSCNIKDQPGSCPGKPANYGKEQTRSPSSPGRWNVPPKSTRIKCVDNQLISCSPSRQARSISQVMTSNAQAKLPAQAIQPDHTRAMMGASHAASHARQIQNSEQDRYNEEKSPDAETHNVPNKIQTTPYQTLEKDKSNPLMSPYQIHEQQNKTKETDRDHNAQKNKSKEPEQYNQPTNPNISEELSPSYQRSMQQNRPVEINKRQSDNLNQVEVRPKQPAESKTSPKHKSAARLARQMELERDLEVTREMLRVQYILNAEYQQELANLRCKANHPVQQPNAVAPMVRVPAAEVKPVVVKPGEIKPVEVKPVVLEPVEVKPVVVEPVEVKPVEVEPVEVKPVVVEPVEVKPVEVEPVEVKPVEEEPVVVEPVVLEAPALVVPEEENTKRHSVTFISPSWTSSDTASGSLVPSPVPTPRGPYADLETVSEVESEPSAIWNVNKGDSISSYKESITDLQSRENSSVGLDIPPPDQLKINQPLEIIEERPESETSKIALANRQEPVARPESSASIDRMRRGSFFSGDKVVPPTKMSDHTMKQRNEPSTSDLSDLEILEVPDENNVKKKDKPPDGGTKSPEPKSPSDNIVATPSQSSPRPDSDSEEELDLPTEIPKERRPSKPLGPFDICFEIHSMKANKTWLEKMKGVVSQLYVEYKFLGMSGPELETKSVGLSRTMYFDYYKTISYASQERQQRLNSMSKAPTWQLAMLQFTVVSEPPDKESSTMDCEEIGYAEVDFRNLLNYQLDMIRKNTVVYGSDGLKESIGTLNISILGTKHFQPSAE